MGAGLIIIRSLSGADYYDAVSDGGCDNTGESDCVSDILAAVTAYKAAGKDGLYFPAGEYLLSSALTVPDGTTLVGSGMTTAWLQGQVWFGSASDFTDLKIGPESAGLAGLKNTDGSDGSSFTRCHFRGGGAESDNDNSSTVNLGDGYDLSNLTFTDCEFERSLGTLWSGSADNTHRENTVTLYAMSNTIDTVTFEGCDIGVSNGVASGNQRMGVETWTYDNVSRWWKNITFKNCHVRPSNITGLDFACYNNSTQGDGVLVEGCTIHGSGVDPKGTAWGQGITLEWPKNVTIKDNTFYCCTEGAIYPDYSNRPNFSAASNLVVTGNIFDFDTSEGGITADSNTGMCVTHGSGGTITGNTFIWHGETNILGCVWFAGEDATGNTCTGNTFNVSATQTICRNTGDAADNGEPWTATNTVNRS
jgi:hypothetical protein